MKERRKYPTKQIKCVVLEIVPENTCYSNGTNIHLYQKKKKRFLNEKCGYKDIYMYTCMHAYKCVLCVCKVFWVQMLGLTSNNPNL